MEKLKENLDADENEANISQKSTQHTLKCHS